MFDFQYYAPTRVVFGRNAEEQTGKLVREQGAGKVLILYGGGSALRSGLLDRVAKTLDREGIPWTALGGVTPNPRLSKVYEGVRVCLREKTDFLLAVGGGSVIDSAKAIGFGAADGGDPWDLYARRREASACLPLGCVPTIAAAGSEMSNSSVITNEEGMIKRGYSSDLCRPRFAVMNPELTRTLPMYQTQSGCVDILMHTLERYLNRGSNMEITDALSEGLLRTVMKAAGILFRDPENDQTRAEIMWAGSLSHNGLTGAGTDGGDWASHQLEHELGGMFDVAHGAGLSAVWGSWARYVYREHPRRFARLACRVLEISPGSGDDETALAGIEAMEAFFRSVSMPVSLRELGVSVTEKQLDELADKCSNGGTRTIGIVRRLDRTDIRRIFAMARN